MREAKNSLDAYISFLHTTDLEKTSEFYEKRLGLSLVLDQGRCRIYQITAGAFMGFCERESVGPVHGVILTLVTNEVDAWYERLSSQGVAFEKSPAFNAEYNIYHCFLRDPNGYLVEIQRFEDPNWKTASGLESRP